MIPAHQSQSTRHVLYLPVVFYFRCDFYLSRGLVKKIKFEPMRISKRPSCVLATRYILLPILFYPSRRLVKKQIFEPTSISKHPLCFISTCRVYF